MALAKSKGDQGIDQDKTGNDPGPQHQPGGQRRNPDQGENANQDCKDTRHHKAQVDGIQGRDVRSQAIERDAATGLSAISGLLRLTGEDPSAKIRQEPEGGIVGGQALTVTSQRARDGETPDHCAWHEDVQQDPGHTGDGCGGDKPAGNAEQCDPCQSGNHRKGYSSCEGETMMAPLPGNQLEQILHADRSPVFIGSSC